MSRLRGFLTRMRGFWRRSVAERELDDEIRHHIEMASRAGVARGLSPDAARREALLAFGGVTRIKDEARDARGLTALDDARADLRHAWRLLRSHPAFSAAAILTLAVGIGANTAIFSVVDAVLLRRSPFADPDRIVMLWETDRGSGTQHEPASWPDVADFRERSRTLSGVDVLVGQDVTIALGGDAERVSGVAVTPGLLPLLGIRPLAGRFFTDDDADAEQWRTVMLAEGFWRSRFNGDPAIIGRTIRLNERPVTVVGVVPAEADLGILQVHRRADYAASFSGARVQVWLVARPTAVVFPRQTHPFLTLARLAPGATVQLAQEELTRIAADIERANPENVNRGVNLESYSDVVFARVRLAMWVLLGAVTLVLLVTCANVVNLLLARAVTRSREVALRQALGASAGRIRRQFLAESALLVALGTAAGVTLAYGGVRALVALAPADIPRIAEATVDGRVLAYTITIAAAAALVFGVLPALQARHLDIHDTLKAQAGRRVSEGPRGRRFRAALIMGEVALAVMLVTGAGLLLRSFWRLQQVDPGFNSSHVLKAQYQLPDSRYRIDYRRWPNVPDITAFHARLLTQVRAIPGVQAAAIANTSPLDPGFTNSFTIPGRDAEQHPEIRTRFLTPGYLATLGVPLVAGRDIGDGDDAKAPPVVLINREGARRYFPGGAVGQTVRFWGTPRTIVGVIGDERFHGVDAPAEPAVYAPMAQNPGQAATLLVRTTGDPMLVAAGVRHAMHDLDPQVALFGVEPLRATLSGTIARPRFSATLLALFAAVAILLALVGVHGVMSYTVTQRVPEMGIRAALGASRWTLMRDVLVEGMALAGAGVAIGVAGALAGSRVLASLMFGVSATDVATFGTVTIAVLATALLASLAPALRATRADPMQALRAE